MKNSFLRFLETCAAAAAPHTNTHTRTPLPAPAPPGAHRSLRARRSYERPSEDGQPPVAEYKERCAPAGARPPPAASGRSANAPPPAACRVEQMKQTWYTTLNVDYGHLLDVRLTTVRRDRPAPAPAPAPAPLDPCAFPDARAAAMCSLTRPWQPRSPPSTTGAQAPSRRPAPPLPLTPAPCAPRQVRAVPPGSGDDLHQAGQPAVLPHHDCG